MTKLGENTPQSTIDGLERRVSRLSILVELATQNSNEKSIRESGAQLIERLSEWLEDIKDLAEVGDEDAHDLVKSFTMRLRLAETKVKAWSIPEAVVRRAFEEEVALPQRRRGRPPKKRMPSAA
jgi:hypothetical protein